MKKLFLGLLIFLIPISLIAAPNVLNYIEQGGSASVIGGSFTVVSGGSLISNSGSTVSMNAVTINSLVATSFTNTTGAFTNLTATIATMSTLVAPVLTVTTLNSLVMADYVTKNYSSAITLNTLVAPTLSSTTFNITTANISAISSSLFAVPTLNFILATTNVTATLNPEENLPIKVNGLIRYLKLFISQ